MQDDGYRLSFSLSDGSFTIVDNLSGKSIINTRGNYTAFTIDREVALNHLKNIQEALMSYQEKQLFLNKIPSLSGTQCLIIRENAHFDWTIGYMGKGAQMVNSKLTYTRGFDKDSILSIINKVYATLLVKDVALNPKRDIVRRIADVGVLVWVYKGHSVVAYEKNISGNCMTGCLIDGLYFPVILVSTSRELNQTTLFNSKLEEILTFPLDDSILSYYSVDEEAFD